MFVFLLSLLIVVLFFFFKQKTAYEMRISDWSSDVCSSDLIQTNHRKVPDPSVQYPPLWIRSHNFPLAGTWDDKLRPVGSADCLVIFRLSCASVITSAVFLVRQQ